MKKLWRTTEFACHLAAVASCVFVLATGRVSDPALWAFSTVAVLELLVANIRRALAIWTHSNDPFVKVATSLRRRTDESNRQEER